MPLGKIRDAFKMIVHRFVTDLGGEIYNEDSFNVSILFSLKYIYIQLTLIHESLNFDNFR